MTSSQGNAAIRAFIDSIGLQGRFGELLISAGTDHYNIRHVDDEDRPASSIPNTTKEELRELAATDSRGRFRPLKSAPTLRPGWQATCTTASELWDLLNIVYPGAVGAWYAISAQQSEQPAAVVSYREFVGRQSGMYRGANQLTDSEAEAVTTACCARSHCLKRRHWTIQGTSEASIETAPQLICLEPCQLLLEMARRESKMKHEPRIRFDLSKSEAKSLLEFLRIAGPIVESDRVADFDSPTNPRRLGRLTDGLQAQFTRQTKDLRE